MAASNPRIAFEALAQYFGLRAKDKFLSKAAGGAEVKDDKKSSKKKKVGVEEQKVLNLLHNEIFGEGSAYKTSDEIWKSLPKALTTKDKGKRKKLLAKALEKDVCITARTGKTAPAGTENKQGIDQGWGLPGDGKVYTIDDIFSGRSGAKLSDKKNISAYQFFPATVGTDVANTDIVSLFMNTCTSVHMSQAIPYMDIRVFDQTPTDTDGQFTRPPSFSLGRFLNGPANKHDVLLAKFQDPNKSDKAPGPTTKSKFIQVAGMEVFTSPQTLVDLTPGAYSRASGGPVDKFRPFLGIESLSITDTPTGAGKISYKSATLNLILYDKGRLKQISQIVAPRRAGSTRFEITYGWSHPDGQNTTRPSDANSGRRIGSLIDSMRVTESYKPSNSRFQFQNDGSVKITLELVMEGTNSLSVQDVGSLAVTDGSVTVSVDEIARLLDSIASTMRSNSVWLQDRSITVPQFLSTPSFESLMTLDEKSIAEIRKLATILKSKADGKLKGVGAKVLELLGTGKRREKKKGSGRKLAGIKAKRKAQAEKIIKNLRSSPDPFLRPAAKGVTGKAFLGNHQKKKKGSYKQKYVSYGKLMIFVLESALAAEDVDLQFIFSAFNRNAGGMFDHNIAQFPIDLTLLNTDLIAEFEKRHKFTVSQFVEFIGEKHIEFQASRAYALSDVYQPNVRGDDGAEKKTAAMEREFKKGNTGFAFSVSQKIRSNLDSIYGAGKRIEPTFTTPLVSMRLVTRPSADGTKKVTRVFFSDVTAGRAMSLGESMTALLKGNFFYTEDYSSSQPKARGTHHAKVYQLSIDALVDQGLVVGLAKYLQTRNPKQTIDGLITKIGKKSGVKKAKSLKAKLEKAMILNTKAKNVKETFFQFSPYLLHGSQGSGIISAEISSEENTKLTDIAISTRMTQAGSDAEATKKAEMNLPFEVHPGSLNLTTFGCPLLQFTQKYFIDLATGTTLDNYYVVVGLSHDIAPGRYETKVTMKPHDAYGKFLNVAGKIENLIVTEEVENLLKKPSGSKKSGGSNPLRHWDSLGRDVDKM